MSNIDYLALGYNAYRGNPQTTDELIDPGFGKNKIFKFTYD